MRQVQDLMGRGRGWESSLPGSKPLLLSSGPTSESFFPTLGAQSPTPIHLVLALAVSTATGAVRTHWSCVASSGRPGGPPGVGNLEGDALSDALSTCPCAGVRRHQHPEHLFRDPSQAEKGRPAP